MTEQRFKRFGVWAKAMDFIEHIYKITNRFPTYETYGLTSQLRRSATSIALNIAEGSGSGSDNEFNRFLNMSLRSSYEAICGIEIAKRLKYCHEKEAYQLLDKCDELSAMISGLKKKLKAAS